MRVSFTQPRPELQPFISTFWVLETEIGSPQAGTNLLVPDGTPKLLILCENSVKSIVEGQSAVCPKGLYLVGNKDRPVLKPANFQPYTMIGIEFYPHGGFPILGMPMREISNHLFDGETAFGRWGRQTWDTVCELSNVTEKIRFIEVQLIGLLKRNHRCDNRLIDFCVRSLKQSDGQMTIRELEQKTGYTRRYLESLFNQHVGLSPKVLAEIFRFQKYFRRWVRNPSYDVLRQEVYDGYSDQAHFIREFKRMTGYTPGKFPVEISTELMRHLYVT